MWTGGCGFKTHESCIICWFCVCIFCCCHHVIGCILQLYKWKLLSVWFCILHSGGIYCHFAQWCCMVEWTIYFCLLAKTIHFGIKIDTWIIHLHWIPIRCVIVSPNHILLSALSHSDGSQMFYDTFIVLLLKSKWFNIFALWFISLFTPWNYFVCVFYYQVFLSSW